MPPWDVAPPSAAVQLKASADGLRSRSAIPHRVIIHIASRMIPVVFAVTTGPFHEGHRQLDDGQPALQDPPDEFDLEAVALGLDAPPPDAAQRARAGDAVLPVT